MQKQKISTTVWAGLITIYLVWGMTYLAIRYLVEVVPPILASGFRSFSAGGLIFLYVYFIKKEPFPDTKTWKESGLAGFLMLTIGSVLLTIAAQWIPSGYVALFPTVIPIWLVLIQWLGGKKPNLGTLAGCLLGIFAVGLLLNLDSLALKGHEQNFLWGVILLILATIGWSFGVILAAKTENRASVAMTAAVQMLVGGTISLLFSATYGEWAGFSIDQLTAKAVYSFLFLMIVGSIIGFLIFSWLSREASPTLVGTHNYVNPLVALTIGYLFADEALNPQLLLSAVLIFAAIFLISKFSNKK